MPDAVAELRAFNRFWTRRIGVLGEGLLGTEHPLPDARVLYELSGPREVADLRTELGMDAGFLSRVLSRLEGRGLVERETSPEDRRRQIARLTRAGERARADLDARSTEVNALSLRGLTAQCQADVIGAMRLVRAKLEPGGGVTLRAPGAGDWGWIVARHGALYAAELGWDERFERLVAEVVGAFQAGPRTAAWIAEAGGVPAGCVLCTADDERTARLRLLLVEPHARGLGLGGRLVDECLTFARAAGYERMVLWTNEPLRAARRIYDARGFALVDQAPHERFGPAVLGQTLQLTL